jgi:hypothetical protein
MVDAVVGGFRRGGENGLVAVRQNEAAQRLLVRGFDVARHVGVLASWYLVLGVMFKPGSGHDCAGP